MKSEAAVLYETVEDENFAESTPVEFEAVEVSEPGEEEVLVEITAASLCHTDIKMATGQIDEPLPMVLGHEGAGVVRAVGEGVTSVSDGDQVVLGRISCGRCTLCRQGHNNLCERRSEAQERGSLRSGGIRFSKDGENHYHCHGVSSFTQYTVVDEEVAIGVPDEIPPEQATLLGCGVFTGFGAVTNTAEVEAGSSVAIFGAGGVGLCAVQGAALSGATDVILVDLIPEKLAVGAELGATHTVDAREDDALDQIRAASDGGVDYAFDIVGSVQTVEQVVDVLAPTGTAVVVGGPPGGKRPYELNVANMVYTEQSLVGSFNGSYDLPEAIPKLADLVVQGRLDIEQMISGTRPLDELNEAMDDMETSTSIRQVIRPN